MWKLIPHGNPGVEMLENQYVMPAPGLVLSNQCKWDLSKIMSDLFKKEN